MSIKEVYCQDKAISFLQRALTAGKVAHAYIFAGPDGIGRFKTAREWAKVLLSIIRGYFPEYINAWKGLFGQMSDIRKRRIEIVGNPNYRRVFPRLLQ